MLAGGGHLPLTLMRAPEAPRGFSGAWPLPVHRRWGLIAYLSEQYYDGWRPSRTEIADLFAVELGVLTPDDYVARAARRRIAPGSAPTSRRC